MTSVNTNIGANQAMASMSKINKEMDSAIARLSSGLRINSASDDAAGMAIASRMESEIRGLEQAMRNSADGLYSEEVEMYRKLHYQIVGFAVGIILASGLTYSTFRKS